MIKIIKLTISLLFILISINIQAQKPEFRGVWIATVANIDWPTNPYSSNEQKKEEFLKILRFYKNLNFNALIVQIRSTGDATYPSRLAPYSKYLTGKSGTPPENNFDFTKWMIDVTHQNGLEFHAWINPYRATTNLDKNSLSHTHDAIKHPEWMINYNNQYLYNPGLPEVQSHLINICSEILNNYDIDALHLDDYFYPYKVPGKEFNDRYTYLKYRKENQSIDEWRRENVNSLIFKIHYLINDSKPWVDFGISPFGVWRNKSKDPRGSETKAGLSNYDDLYADILLWVNNGWIDYLAPQLYWSLNYPLASYRTLTEWWSSNSNNTNVYIGNSPFKIKNNKDKAWYNNMEIPNQIKLGRETENIKGNIFFSAKSLMKHADISKIIQNKLYNSPTLVPKTKNISNKIAPPKVIKHNNLIAEIQIPNHSKIRWLCTYYKNSETNEWFLKDKIFVTNSNLKVNIDPFIGTQNISISLIDLYKTESEKVIVNKQNSPIYR